MGTDRPGEPTRINFIAQQDSELDEWLLGIINGKPTRPGGFLYALAEAAMRADAENYPLMRPSLLAIKARYPDYRYPR